MTTYRVEYSNEARATRAALSATRRRAFDTGMATLAKNPYAGGSRAIRERDYREAVVGGCITVYYVSSGVLVVSVVRIQGPP